MSHELAADGTPRSPDGATNTSDHVIEVTGVSFDQLDNLGVIEASLLPSDSAGLTDGYPPTFPSEVAWAGRISLGDEAAIASGAQMRVMVALGLLGDAVTGTAQGLVLTYVDSDGTHEQRAPLEIEVRSGGTCSGS